MDALAQRKDRQVVVEFRGQRFHAQRLDLKLDRIEQVTWDCGARGGHDATHADAESEARVQARTAQPPHLRAAHRWLRDALARGDELVRHHPAQAATEQRIGLELSANALDVAANQLVGRQRGMRQAHRSDPRVRWRRSDSMARKVRPRMVPAWRPMIWAASSADSPAA